MKLSIAEAAAVLGKSERQVRYQIKTGELRAAKEGQRWRIDGADLPLSAAERQALVERSQVARRAFEKGLEPVVKAALSSPAGAAAGKESGDPAAGGRSGGGAGGEETKRAYSVRDLRAFQAGEAIYREARRDLGAEEPAVRQLFEALSLLSRGCHCYHPKDKAGRFTEARELAATAVAALLLHEAEEDAVRRGLAQRIEQEMIPKVAGLVASYEKRGRRGRFERFGSAAGRSR